MTAYTTIARAGMEVVSFSGSLTRTLENITFDERTSTNKKRSNICTSNQIGVFLITTKLYWFKALLSSIEQTETFGTTYCQFAFVVVFF